MSRRRRLRPGESLVEETAAFLLGRSPELFSASGQAPPWAWLNPVVHQEPERVTALAAAVGSRRLRWGTWEWAVSTLAGELAQLSRGDPETMRALQGECLLPLELLLLSHPVPDLSAAELVALASARLRQGSGLDD